MRKTNIRSYLLITVILLLFFSIPESSVEKIESSCIASLSPLWIRLSSWKERKANEHSEEALLLLELENQRLKNEMEELQEQLVMKKELPEGALFGRVFFRSQSSWNSTLWIDLGRENSKIEKNSPVLLGKAVVGLIDFVGENESRVRLITDTSLTPSVRVKRVVKDKTLFLAKGELIGSQAPYISSNKLTIKGVGFNYDFPDEEGPARDLRPKGAEDVIPIVQTGDLLVTTGLDGVFPKNLEVAVVTKVYTLKEGDYFYELEARPLAGTLKELSYLFIIQPLRHLASDPKIR